MLHMLSKFCLKERSDSTNYSSGEIRTASDILDSEFYHSCIAQEQWFLWCILLSFFLYSSRLLLIFRTTCQNLLVFSYVLDTYTLETYQNYIMKGIFSGGLELAFSGS